MDPKMSRFSAARGFLAGVLAVAAFAAVAVSINSADTVPIVAADVFKPAGTNDTGAMRAARKAVVLYANATLGPTDAIDTTSLDTTGIELILCKINNANTTVTRTFTFSFRTSADAQMDTIVPAACAAATVCTYGIGLGATTTGLTNAYAVPPAPKFKLTAPAPGSGTGTGDVYCWGK
jgi:hypothetical protein